MLSENEMFDFIKKIAQQNEKIRAVILNGSRAYKSVKKDRFQDFDVVYLTNDLQYLKAGTTRRSCPACAWRKLACSSPGVSLPHSISRRTR
ncbi:MAG: aminoglycoside 6-adenylyltransferase [Caldilineaceae bacterium]|nr:aminoglycoside 6-adenylyltransferase [Caldilineaceae bacterium]